jgi:hypothetical protein
MLHLVLLFFLTVWQAASESPAEKLMAVYDARLSPKPAKLAPADVALTRRAARSAWGNRQNCDSGFEALDIANGSFTRAQASQKAILYRHCTTGHNFALDGIAIVEDGKLITHLAYEGAWDNAIGALPDINRNGLSEIIVATGGTNQGITWGVVSIIELAADGVAKLGHFETYEDNCGALDKKKSTIHKLYVKAGANPVFYRETFSKRGCDNRSNWIRSSSAERIEADKDEIEYRRFN